MSSRRIFLACVAAAGLTVAAPLLAQTPPAPMVLYDDGLQNGWQDWSWGTTNTLQAPAGEVKPIKIEGTPWSALQLHHDPVSTAGYTKLTFYINGGIDGGQNLTIHIRTKDGVSQPSTFTIQPKVKTWDTVEVSLKDLGGDNQTITDVIFQAGGDAYKPYYITKIKLQ